MAQKHSPTAPHRGYFAINKGGLSRHRASEGLPEPPTNADPEPLYFLSILPAQIVPELGNMVCGGCYD